MKIRTPIAQWIIGYGVSLVCIFTICSVALGLSTTIWGFVSIFTGCAIASLAFWWQDEHRWKKSLLSQATTTLASPSAPLPIGAALQPAFQSSQQNQDWLPLDADDFDLLETYTQDLTERVEMVYPLVDRDHVHKIVWTVMIELFCKRMESAAHTTPATIIAAKIARAA